mgnify:CR=1 FL=1
MKKANSLIRRDPEVLDPKTNNPMKILLWPPTKQLKEIPIPQHFQDGYLDRMEFWEINEVTTTAAIKFSNSDTVL